ncbi:hypothetical protein Tco_1175232 [Tanacetum coccineum]
MKRSSSSTSTSQNLAFLSFENTTASGDFGVSTAGGISQVSSTPCAHDVVFTTPCSHDEACSFLHRPTIRPHLNNEDIQRLMKMTCGINASTNESSSQVMALVASDGLGRL